MRNKCLSGIIAVFLLFSPLTHGRAESHTVAPPLVESVEMEKDGNRLSYPQLTGWPDEVVQQTINDDIVLSAGLTAHMITFATLTPDSLWGLQVSYDACVTDRVASFVISAEGKMPNNRQGQSNTALAYDLTTGLRLSAADLFDAPDAAQQWLESETLRTLGEEISDYEDSAALLPLPMDSFMLDEYGITFYYAAEQFSTVDGRAGAIRFDYAELQHLLRKDEEGIPANAGMLLPSLTEAEQLAAIHKAAETGRMEQLPVALGDAMSDLIEGYGLRRTPDEFPGGRYFTMDDPMFRSILLISDNMESGYDHSVLEGIQLRRGAFCGLLVGQAQRQEWQSLLGQADEVILLTENMAYDYDLPVGSCDLYDFGSVTIRFYADEAGVLSAVQFESN